MGSQVDNGSKDLDSTVLRCQINQFSRHIVGFSAESDGVGKYLGTGILVPSPTANVPALATCSHVLSELKAREVVFCSALRLTGDGHKKNAWAHVKLSGDFNCFDFGDSESLAGIGLDPLKDAKDLAFFSHPALLTLQFHGCETIEPETVFEISHTDESRYVLLGFPVHLRGGLVVQELLLQSESRYGSLRFTIKNPNPSKLRSYVGASGGLIVEARSFGFRPVAVLVKEAGIVAEASLESSDRGEGSPSCFDALPLSNFKFLMEHLCRTINPKTHSFTLDRKSSRLVRLDSAVRAALTSAHR